MQYILEINHLLLINIHFSFLYFIAFIIVKLYGKEVNKTAATGVNVNLKEVSVLARDDTFSVPTKPSKP